MKKVPCDETSTDGAREVRRVPVECYSRIVGYLRPLRDWNPGKLAEFKDRRVYKTPGDHDLK